MASELKMSELNRAFDRGPMALDVFFDAIIGQDVRLELDAADPRDTVAWLFQVGAQSVTVSPARLSGEASGQPNAGTGHSGEGADIAARKFTPR